MEVDFIHLTHLPSHSSKTGRGTATFGKQNVQNTASKFHDGTFINKRQLRGELFPSSSRSHKINGGILRAVSILSGTVKNLIIAQYKE